MSTRIVVKDSGEVHIIDVSHSQLCQYVDGVSRDDFKRFLSGEQIENSVGQKIKKIMDREVNL